MDRNLIKACNFILKNKIINEDLTVDLENKELRYKEFSWSLTLDTEVSVVEFNTPGGGTVFSILTLEDCDGYKIEIKSNGDIILDIPEEEYDELEDIKRKIESLEEIVKKLNNNSLFPNMEEIKRIQELLNNYEPNLPFIPVGLERL